jgi:hypothetical protein
MSNIIRVPNVGVDGTPDGTFSLVDLANNTVEMSDQSGKLVKMDLGTGDVHIEVPLANYATGYKMDGGVADQISPIVMVDKANDKFWQWDKDDAFEQAQDIVNTPGSNPNEITPRQSNTNYATVQRALATFLPSEVEAQGDNTLMLAMRYMSRPMYALMISRERRVALMVTDASNNFTSASYKETLGGTAKWNGGSTSDPVANIHARVDAALKPITHMIMNGRTYRAFQRNAQVQKYIASKTNIKPQQSTASAKEWSSILELPEIIVAEQKYKTASGYDYIFPNHVALMHLPESMPPNGEPISWNTFRWKGGTTAEGVTVEGGFAVRSFFNQYRGAAGGRQIIVFHQDHDYFVEQAVSGLIIDAYQ